MSSRELLLDNGLPPEHVVQLYRPGARSLMRSVGRYLSDGLRRGDAGLVVATKEHIEGFLQQLAQAGLNPDFLQKQGQLLILDAHRTLAGLMIDNQPSALLFEKSIGHAVRNFRGQTWGGMLRAYGEMVGVLWSSGQFSAAMALEELWNDLLKDIPFSLFCSYPIDVFDRSFHRCDVDAVMCSHTHMIPDGIDGDLEFAVSRAMDDSVGSSHVDWKASFRKAEHPSWAASLKGEALILWIRENYAQAADDILFRARDYFDKAQELSVT